MAKLGNYKLSDLITKNNGLTTLMYGNVCETELNVINGSVSAKTSVIAAFTIKDKEISIQMNEGKNKDCFIFKLRNLLDSIDFPYHEPITAFIRLLMALDQIESKWNEYQEEKESFIGIAFETDARDYDIYIYDYVSSISIDYYLEDLGDKIKDTKAAWGMIVCTLEDFDLGKIK